MTRPCVWCAKHTTSPIRVCNDIAVHNITPEQAINLTDLLGSNDDAHWMTRPDLNCAMPADTDPRARRTNADGYWYPRDKFYGATKAACAGCPETTACLQYALDNNEEHGIWGGTTPAERSKLLKQAAA